MAKGPRKPTKAQTDEDDGVTSRRLGMALRSPGSRKVPTKLQTTPGVEKRNGKRKREEHVDDSAAAGNDQSPSLSLEGSKPIRATERMRRILGKLEMERLNKKQKQKQRTKKLTSVATPPPPVHAQLKSPTKEKKVALLPIRNTPPRKAKKPRPATPLSQAESKNDRVADNRPVETPKSRSHVPAILTDNPLETRKSPRKKQTVSKNCSKHDRSCSPTQTPLPDPTYRPPPPEFDDHEASDEEYVSDEGEDEGRPNPTSAPSVRCRTARNKSGDEGGNKRKVRGVVNGARLAAYKHAHTKGLPIKVAMRADQEGLVDEEVNSMMIHEIESAVREKVPMLASSFKKLEEKDRLVVIDHLTVIIQLSDSDIK